MKLSPAFVVTNGKKYEVHQRETDADGRQWELTTGGPFVSRADAENIADKINYTHYGLDHLQ